MSFSLRCMNSSQWASTGRSKRLLESTHLTVHWFNQMASLTCDQGMKKRGMDDFRARASYTGTILGEPLPLQPLIYIEHNYGIKHPKEEGRAMVEGRGRRVARGTWGGCKKRMDSFLTPVNSFSKFGSL